MSEVIKHKYHEVDVNHLQFEIPYIEARLEKLMPVYRETKKEKEDLEEWLEIIKREHLVRKMAGVK